METQPRIAINKLVFGICLVAVGLAAFLGAIDVWHIRHIGRFWPFILIALGLAGQFEAVRRRKNDGSYMLLAIGCWMLAGAFGFFGLTYSSAMPIAVVVVGFALVLHAVIDRPVHLNEEKDNVR
jgi:cell wall-active antibiotic response 4TMS protein YvqF